MNRRIVAFAALLLVACAPGAWALGKGTSMFALQLAHGIADFAGPGDGTYIDAFDHSEVGIQGQFWYMMSSDYAMAISGGYGFFSESDEPGDSTTAKEKKKYSQAAFNVRVGGDRVVKLGDRALLYFGPGVEFWSGKAKFENFAFPPPLDKSAVETGSTKRFSLSARIGGTMLIGPAWGLTGHVGHKVGYATVTDKGSKATWWPSSVDAAGGVVFVFGGE